MTIIEYKLHPSSDGMRTPDFVDDGGYWNNPEDYTSIGTVPDGVEYYVPDTITTYTLAELQARQRSIHANYPMKKEFQTETMNDDEVDQVIADWVAERQ
jgi:hypothetical protein